MWTTLIWMSLTCKWITEVYLVSQRITQLHTYELLIPGPLYVLFPFAFWIGVWIEWDFSPDSVLSHCRRGRKRLKYEAEYEIMFNKYTQINRIRNLDGAECTTAPVTCILNMKDTSGKHQRVQIRLMQWAASAVCLWHWFGTSSFWDLVRGTMSVCWQNSRLQSAWNSHCFSAGSIQDSQLAANCMWLNKNTHKS